MHAGHTRTICCTPALAGHVGDHVGESLFHTVGVVSAVADAELLAGTALVRYNGAAHVADRWLATSGGLYFALPAVATVLGRGSATTADTLAAASLPLCLLCLRTARRQTCERRWALWQTAWHVLSAATMTGHIIASRPDSEL